MFEIFKTVLLLSAAGVCATLILLALKPLALRKFPAMWQRNLWIIAAVVMLLPFWRLVPRQSIERIAPRNVTQVQSDTAATDTDFDLKTVVIEDIPMEYREAACGIAVIDGMDDAHRRIYMETILNMPEKGR